MLFKSDVDNYAKNFDLLIFITILIFINLKENNAETI